MGCFFTLWSSFVKVVHTKKPNVYPHPHDFDDLCKFYQENIYAFSPPNMCDHYSLFPVSPTQPGNVLLAMSLILIHLYRGAHRYSPLASVHYTGIFNGIRGKYNKTHSNTYCVNAQAYKHFVSFKIFIPRCHIYNPVIRYGHS